MQLYQVTSLNTSPTWYSNVSFFECRYINLVAEHILTTAPDRRSSVFVLMNKTFFQLFAENSSHQDPHFLPEVAQYTDQTHPYE
ncbi:uncharacterized protein LOC114354712 isoform X3 [Ostrinia furnacalis]|uniref:uncharacterized protein LOC114354712 isoform X3 n=1 Tax=Ostrinia furnacalis TaxID=93504 RepID=UPI001039A45A|nr:uncharacterized protein LOC114354712 isoform X3 [Ostrinia furnacalis]